ncbi:flavin reductase family protein [Haloechinothrix salitolerans]|uniref:Flavin reductase family protein n=1 Tax=Haloechinothrix salitolerans TaxID=926830 RepID=A0ABW2BYW8_9PSEU
MLADTHTLASPVSTTDVYDFDEQSAESWQVPHDFRHGIRSLTRGVTVLTTSDNQGERYGVTTTGVCALSMDPPTLVVCVRRRSTLGAQLPRTRRFCVNVLSWRQRDIAEVFAGQRGVAVDRFKHGEWTTGVHGSPVLTDALASFECEVDLLYGYPNHLIVVGSVRQVEEAREQDDPLVYASGQLSSLVPSGALGPMDTAMATPA